MLGWEVGEKPLEPCKITGGPKENKQGGQEGNSMGVVGVEEGEHMKKSLLMETVCLL